MTPPPRTPPTRAQRRIANHWSACRAGFAVSGLALVGLFTLQVREDETTSTRWFLTALLGVVLAMNVYSFRTVRRYVERWDAEHGGPPSEAGPGSG